MKQQKQNKSILNKKKKQNIQNIQFSFLSALSIVCLYTVLKISVPNTMLAEMDLTLIPTYGKLADAFKSGDFSFKLILLYGMYLIKLTATSAGVIYMIMNIIAGLKYITSGASGEKEGGKQALIMAFYGFALAISAWIIVDIFISFFSSGV